MKSLLFWEKDLWEVFRSRVLLVGLMVTEVYGWAVSEVDSNDWPSSAVCGLEHMVQEEEVVVASFCSEFGCESASSEDVGVVHW